MGTAWPTPSASNPNEQEDLDSWQERRTRIKAEKKNGNGFGMPLGVAVRLASGDEDDDAGKSARLLNEHYDELTPEERAHHVQVVNAYWERQPPPDSSHPPMLWPTPSTSDGDGGRMASEQTVLSGTRPSGQKAQISLAEATRYWPSPRATDGEKGGPHMRGSKGDLMLPSAVQQQEHWPTPRAAATRSSRKSLVENRQWSAPSLDQMIELSEGTLPREYATEDELTPQARRVYAAAEVLWPTPNTTDYKGSNRPGQRRRQLSEAAEVLWATPKAHDGDGRGAQPLPTRLAGGHTCDLRDQVHSPGAGQLHPAWVEILCGFPVGWTDPAVPNEALAPWPGWPARPGCRAMPYEPPRTGRGIKQRNKRLKGLGNACVSLHAYPVFAAIMAVEEECAVLIASVANG